MFKTCPRLVTNPPAVPSTRSIKASLCRRSLAYLLPLSIRIVSHRAIRCWKAHGMCHKIWGLTPSLVEPAFHGRWSARRRRGILCGVISRAILGDWDAQSVIVVVNVCRALPCRKIRINAIVIYIY